MKFSLLISIFMTFTLMARSFASDRIHWGISLLTSKTDSVDEYNVNGVVFAEYDGLEFDIKKDRLINLVPTTAEISVGGKQVRVFTDLATLEYYGLENIQLNVSAISLDYDKLDGFAIKSTQKAAAIDMSATTFKTLGIIDFDFTAGVSLGGYTKAKIIVDDGETDPYTHNNRDTHYGTVDFSVGGTVNVVDEVDLYFYGGTYKQFGDNTTERGVYAGASLYGGEITEDLPYTISVEYQKKKINFEDLFRTEEDSQILFQIKVLF